MEHDILFTSPAFYFGPPAIHVHIFLNSRISLGAKPIFRLCPSLVSSQPSPPKLDFGSALFLAPAVTVGETEGAMDSTSVFFASSFAYNFVRK